MEAPTGPAAPGGGFVPPAGVAAATTDATAAPEAGAAPAEAATAMEVEPATAAAAAAAPADAAERPERPKRAAVATRKDYGPRGGVSKAGGGGGGAKGKAKAAKAVAKTPGPKREASTRIRKFPATLKVPRQATAIPLGRSVIGVTHYLRTGRYEAHIWISGKDAETFEREGRRAAGGGGGAASKKRKSCDGNGEGEQQQQQQQNEKKKNKGRGYQLHLGAFPDEHHAKLAYDRASWRSRGPLAPRNDPGRDLSTDEFLLRHAALSFPDFVLALRAWGQSLMPPRPPRRCVTLYSPEGGGGAAAAKEGGGEGVGGEAAAAAAAAAAAKTAAAFGPLSFRAPAKTAATGRKPRVPIISGVLRGENDGPGPGQPLQERLRLEPATPEQLLALAAGSAAEADRRREQEVQQAAQEAYWRGAAVVAGVFCSAPSSASSLVPQGAPLVSPAEAAALVGRIAEAAAAAPALPASVLAWRPSPAAWAAARDEVARLLPRLAARQREEQQQQQQQREQEQQQQQREQEQQQQQMQMQMQVEELLCEPAVVSPSARLRVASAFEAALEGGGEAATAVVAVVAPAPPVDEVNAADDGTQTLRPLRTSSIMRMVWVDSDS